MTELKERPRTRGERPVHKSKPSRGTASLVALISLSGIALGVAMRFVAPVLTSDVASPVTPALTASPERAFRAFSPTSWWNTPLPAKAPLNPNADLILSYLRTAPDSGDGCLSLAGAGEGKWGQPVYWAGPGDPFYDVKGTKHYRPPELDHLRIPLGAEPPDNNDASMTIFDRHRGTVALLSGAAYDATTDTWTAAGATVTYLHSNGLNVLTDQSDNSHNTGSHRGNNGATSVVRWDMVEAGVVNHVLKVASGPEVSDRAVFPMVGSDGHYTGTDPAVPPQGLRFRIKPSVNLDALGLPPQALVIARALQRYGFYIGDSGGVTALKLEDTVAESRGQLWDLAANDLCGLPFTPAYWDVIAEGYDPSRVR